MADIGKSGKKSAETVTFASDNEENLETRLLFSSLKALTKLLSQEVMDSQLSLFLQEYEGPFWKLVAHSNEYNSTVSFTYYIYSVFFLSCLPIETL